MPVISPTFQKLKDVSVDMAMRPPCPEPDRHPLLGVTAEELVEVAGAVQKAKIIKSERDVSFGKALHEALWDHIDAPIKRLPIPSDQPASAGCFVPACRR